jgi:hypothetical protein
MPRAAKAGIGPFDAAFCDRADPLIQLKYNNYYSQPAGIYLAVLCPEGLRAPAKAQAFVPSQPAIKTIDGDGQWTWIM